MPKIKTEVAKGIEPKEGEDYIIEGVEVTKTQQQGFSAYRVKMRSVDENDSDEYTSMLWDAEVVSRFSKLGSFIYAFNEYKKDTDFGLDTDNWLNARIRVLSWATGKREIRVVDTP